MDLFHTPEELYQEAIKRHETKKQLAHDDESNGVKKNGQTLQAPQIISIL